MVECRGMKLSRNKTEHMSVNEKEASGTMKLLQGVEMEKSHEFKYSGQLFKASGSVVRVVKKQVQAK